MSNALFIAPTPVFELKGSLLTLMVLRLLDSNNNKIAEQFAKKVAQAPHLLQNAPIVIDLKAVNEDDKVDLPFLVNLLRTRGLVVIATRGGNDQQNEVALSLGLGLLPRTKSERLSKQSVAIPSLATKIVTHPIRSGQQVVALNGDLVILSTVSPGAEVLALRHIHIYGALRGRALAGVNGDDEARIFCQHFDAELVSVAGQYQIELDGNLGNGPAQIYLENGMLKIESLESYPR